MDDCFFDNMRFSPRAGHGTYLMTVSYGIVSAVNNTVTSVVFAASYFTIDIRSSKPLYGRRKDIADAALSLDYARHTRIDLQFVPQPPDVDAPIEDIFVNSGGSQQMLRREGPLRCIEKGAQQGILTFAQRARGPVGIDEFSATTIKLPAVESVTAPLRISGSCDSSDFLSPQHGTDACE